MELEIAGMLEEDGAGGCAGGGRELVVGGLVWTAF